MSNFDKNDINLLIENLSKISDLALKYEKSMVYMDRPRCIDGSLDMRFKVNRGLNKYGHYPVEKEGPSVDDY